MLFARLLIGCSVCAGKVLVFPEERAIGSGATLRNAPSTSQESLSLCIDIMLGVMKKQPIILGSRYKDIYIYTPTSLDRFYVKVKQLFYIAKPQGGKLVPYLYSTLCLSYDAGTSNVIIAHNGEIVFTKQDPLQAEVPFTSNYLRGLPLGLSNDGNSFTGELTRLDIWFIALPSEVLVARSRCEGAAKISGLSVPVLPWDASTWLLKEVKQKESASPCLVPQTEKLSVLMPYGAESQQNALDMCEELGGGMPPPQSEQDMLASLAKASAQYNISTCTDNLWLPYTLNSASPAKWTVYRGSDESLQGYTKPPWLEWKKGQPNGGGRANGLEECVAADIGNGRDPGLYDVDCGNPDSCFMCSFKHVIQFYLKGVCKELADLIDTTYFVNYKEVTEDISKGIIFKGYKGSIIKFNKTINRWSISSRTTAKSLLVQRSQVISLSNLLLSMFPALASNWASGMGNG